MTCYHPLDAWQADRPNDSGTFDIVFSYDRRHPKHILIPCGKCIGCRLEYSRQWAQRCMAEAHMHEANCFLTLTYDDEHVPWTSCGEQTLYKRDVQLFLKRLRKELPCKIRFFNCGEYGSKSHRPHYHMILFGYDFPDRFLWSTNFQGDKFYRSPLLEKIWFKGQSLISDVTFDSCAYVARYILKKQYGKTSDCYEYYAPEFLTMSRKPGIGKAYFNKYHSCIYPLDKLVLGEHGDDRLVAKPPRYFDSLYAELEPEKMDEIKKRRAAYAKKNEADVYTGRLRDREKHKELITKRLRSRDYEKSL